MACTNSPNGDFNHCCQQHDAYYDDGSISRFSADNKLFMCIATKPGRSILNKLWHTLIVAPLYWSAVRVLGRSRYNSE